MNAFVKLDADIRKKVVLENDDKTFNASDVLEICERLNIPMVLDLHHHVCNHNGENLSEMMPQIIHTWTGKKPKIHLSSGKTGTIDRSHADYIRFEDYLHAYKLVGDVFDIMLEAKELRRF